MKAYGHKCTGPVDCCPGHSKWAVQTKHNKRGPRFNRDASRRPFKKAARRAGRKSMLEE